jgi:hypothetical protein
MSLTHGLIDSATIHSAIALLRLGSDSKAVGTWERQCILDATYLLLFEDMWIAPGSGLFRGASGFLEDVLKKLPSLAKIVFTRDKVEESLQLAKTWAASNPSDVRTAWEMLNSQPEFPIWSVVSRDLFWVDHVQMHDALFNTEFIPQIATLLGSSTEEIEKIRLRSRDKKIVRQWIKSSSAGSEADIAQKAYAADVLLRGRYHEYAATKNGFHLCGHPMRKPVEIPISSTSAEPVYTSEEYFVKMIIGSALLETTEDRRVKTWLENIVKARNQIIDLKSVALPPAVLLIDAENRAAEAAKICGISASYGWLRRGLDVAHHRDSSVGDAAADLLMNTKRRFKRLAEKAPGRIERKLKNISKAV